MSANTPRTLGERWLDLWATPEERAQRENERLKSIQRARQLEAENAKLREDHRARPAMARPDRRCRMIRCCLCRDHSNAMIEPTDLPGTGWRCTDHDACRQRVRATIAAQVGLAEVCE